MSVLIVGVGTMGHAVATRMMAAGVDVWGVDTCVVHAAGDDPTAVAAIDGVRVLGSLAAAARVMAAPPSDVLIFVRMPAQVVEVLEGLDSLAYFDGVPAAVLSTLAPSDAHAMMSRFGAHRPLAETPVSGGVEGARDGALTVMAHGPTGEWLEVISQTVVRFEKPGHPAAAKLLNNFLAAANVHALASVLLHADALGLGADRLMEIVEISSGASWMTSRFTEFPIDLLWKDVTLLDADSAAVVPELSACTEFAAAIVAARAALRR